MSFQFNSDREQIRGVDSTIVGSNSVRLRAGAGSNEREIIQAVIDSGTNLPRVGINRTGRRVERIDVLSPGTGYTDTPTINFSAPTLPGGITPVATANTDSFGRIISILIDNPGDGYDIAPVVTIDGGNGFGASGQAFLDSIDFELDINGAIRTSTSIISDTANILNLDIDNLVTPDIKVRAPHLKVFLNGVGQPFPDTAEPININQYFYAGKNVYQALNQGTCDLLPPDHEDGVVTNGDVRFKHIGYRVDAPNDKFYGEGGDSGIFPRSITPLLGDRSDKIATTEYVLNLATNDVGGRIYVSEQIGDDDNDGRSPVNPVRTIKKACQLAWETPGVKESIIIAGGEYLEDNPISIPPDASVVGDNLRLVIIRPNNPGKHIFKFGDKNYVIGVTYQDKVNSSGASVGTWDFAMVFDDKQRITYDASANGDFGTSFPVGHQFFGPQKFKASFTFNTGGSSLVAGTIARGATTGVVARINIVDFDITDVTDANAFVTGSIADVVGVSGTFQSSESFVYGGQGTLRWDGGQVYQLGDLVWNIDNVYEVTTAGVSGTVGPIHTDTTATTDDAGQVFYTYVRDAYEFNANNVSSTRAEAEVVFEGRDRAVQNVEEVPVVRIDFSLQGTFTDGYQDNFYGSAEDLGGVVFYTNLLEGASNVHDFKEGEEIEITGMPTGTPNLGFLNGIQRIYKVIEDADGRSRRFVIPKKIDPALSLNAISDWNPESQGAVISVKSASKSVTMTLLNSPNKFPESQPVERRFQDACLQIRNNIDFIADEVVGRVNDQFKKEYYSVYDVTTLNFKIYLGPNSIVHTYISGGTATVGGNTYNVTDFTYDNAVTGEATVTVDNPHGLLEDDTVQLNGILVQCVINGVVTQKEYPSFSIPISDTKCRRDVGHFLNALIRDLEYGSNYNIIESALKYVDAGQIEYVDYEIIQTVRAIEYARELATLAMRKWRTGNGLTGPVYSPVYTTLDAYIDPTIIDDTVGSPACANVANAINTLSYLFVDVLANNASGTYLDAAYLIARNRDLIADEAYLNTKQQYPSLGLNNVDERKCRRDVNKVLSGVLRDLVLGGNTGAVNAAELYYTGTTLTGVPASELGATRFAFQKVRDLSIQAMRNWETASGSAVTNNFTVIPQFTDGTILVDANGTPTAQLTPTDATYNPGTGEFIMTFASAHGVTASESIRLNVESFVFTCGMDGNKTEHYLPDTDQNAASGLLAITGVTTNTITVNVGVSGPDVTYTPTAATYNPANGNFTMEIGTHTLSLGEGIVLDDNSFTFTCAMDGDDSQKTYPRPGIDPFAGKSMKITGSTATSITVNVGASAANQNFQPSNATYDPATGDMVVTVGQHGLGVGRNVVLGDNSFTFTCDMDNNATEKSYPRPGVDPFAGKSIAITNVGVTTHSPSNATYSPTAGTIVFTQNGHTFSTGDYIKVDDNAITFTCDLDGNASNHTYPRSYDYGSGRWFDITVIDANQYRIEGLPVPRDTSAHTFIGFTPNGLSRQDGTFTINVGLSGSDVNFTPTGAVYDPSTGDLELTIGSHSLSQGQGIVIADNSLSFSCDMDNRDSTKTYPRPGIDPFSGRSIPITATTANTITVDAGISGPNKYFTPSAATYSPVTGDMTVTVGQHGLGVGRSVVLEDNSFTFTCLTDPTDPKTYPRPGNDPFAGKSIAITAVGSTQHTATDAPYDASTGIITFTVASHGFSNGDYIKVDDGSLVYTCDLDGNTVQKSYPRANYDYPSGRWIEIFGVTTDSFQINVGSSSYTGTHTFVSAAANGIERQDGTFTIFVGTSSDTSAHTFVSATSNAIKHEPQSTHYFEGATANAISHLPQSVHTFVRATSTAVQHLPQSAHTFVSATTNAVKHLPQSAHTFKRTVGTNPVSAYPSGGNAICANVEATLATSFGIIDGILEFESDPLSATAIQPGTTTRTTGTLYAGDDVLSYPDNVLRDALNNTVTIRAVYDDLPIISASPYTQNASIISKIGGSGALIDGSKVKSPNCPFAGLTDGRATFPNQGKSMVAAAFTIVSEQNGIGYKIIEDGYVQLVSVFCIFCVDGILCESGGYASVTNSASNFGQFALRSTGVRREPYEFDAGFRTSTGYNRAFIDVVSESVTGNTEFTIDNIGRVPLEHYVVRIDGYESADLEDEYFIDKVELLREGPPYRARITITDGSGGGGANFRDKATGNIISNSSLSTKLIALHRPSICNSSSHTWEFVGSGTDYNALPENGGVKIDSNEQVSENYGRTYVSGTDELGDFKVGTFAKIENRTGNITFTGTVSISEVEFLKLRGGDVVVTGFDNSNTLGGSQSTDSKLPTQKAVKDYITNNLGQYINKNYSTNALPRALVELNDSGKISESQLPPISPINVFSVETQSERLALEGVNAGDIVIEDGTPFILNTDNDSVFLAIVPDTSLQFTTFDVFTGSNTGGKIQLTEYRPGVIREIVIDDPGSGFSSAPSIVINPSALGTQLGHVAAAAEAQVVNGEIVAINIQNSNALLGGKGYLDDSNNSVTITFSGGGGTGAQASVFLESRLYGDIVNNIKPVVGETILSSDVPAEVVNISRVVNTSGSNNSNWTSLSTSTVDASDIIGIIPTSKLASDNEAANSNTALFGDQSYKKVVKSVRATEKRYFIKTADVSGSDTLLFNASDSQTANLLIGHEIIGVTGVQVGTTITQIADITVGITVYKRITLSDGLTSQVAADTIIEFERPPSPVLFESLIPTSDFVESVQIESGGTGFDNGTFNNVQITPTNAGPDAEGLQLKFVIENGVVTACTVDNGGGGFENDFLLTDIPTETIGNGSALILRVKVNTEDKLHSDVGIDIARANNDTLSDQAFGNVGVVRFRKSQFDVGSNGAVTLFTGIDSGLDADILDGQQGSYYRNADNINGGILKPAFLSSTETYNISISQSSGETAKLTSKTGALLADGIPREFVPGASIDVRRNSTNGLLDPEFKEAIDQQTGTTTLISTANDYNTVMSIRGGGDDTSNPYGGVLQLGFTDANNMWIRGSSASVSTTATFSAWAKLWSSGNDYSSDPANSNTVAGPNAYRLRNRTGQWYQNASTMIHGSVLDNRMPGYQTKKDFNTRIRLLEDSGAGVRYSIYILKVTASIVNELENNTLFTQSPFVVKLLDAFGNDPGEISISNIRILNNDGTPVVTSSTSLDYTQIYAVVTGTLITGSFNGTVEIGDNTIQIPFDDFTISEYDGNADGMPDGNIEISRLESDNGTAKFFLGRSDGVANSETEPTIFFRSSEDGGTGDFYTAALRATGGTDALGSGSLNVLITDPDEFKVGGNTVWNAGNVVFNSTNTASTTDANGAITLKSAVFRDENGDFAANVITASLTGLASLNLPLTGGDLTGTLNIGDSNNDKALNVYGPTLLFGTLGVEDDLTVDAGTLFVDASENKVGIGTLVFTADTSAKLLIDASSAAPGYVTTTGGNANLGSGYRLLHQGGGGRTNISGRWEMAFGSDQTTYGAGQNSLGATEGLYFTHTDGSTTGVPLILKRNKDVIVPFKLGVGTKSPGFTMEVIGDARASTALTIGDTANNNGAPLYFLGATGGLVGGTSSYLSNFRIGNQLTGSDMFEITAGDHSDVNNEWKTTPAIAIQGTTNRVAINTTLFGGTDPDKTDVNGDAIERDYILNVQGDINFNGLVFQDNAEFVTSRWTEAPNETDIYRATKVGINFLTAKNPDYDLEVDGDIGLTGSMYANDDPLWLDSFGVIKVNRATLEEDVTITAGLNAVSNGPISINSGTVTVDAGATWVIT